jgi:hypothetical protein
MLRPRVAQQPQQRQNTSCRVPTPNEVSTRKAGTRLSCVTKSATAQGSCIQVPAGWGTACAVSKIWLILVASRLLFASGLRMHIDTTTWARWQMARTPLSHTHLPFTHSLHPTVSLMDSNLAQTGLTESPTYFGIFGFFGHFGHG